MNEDTLLPYYAEPSDPEKFRALLNNIRPLIADGRAEYICLAMPDNDSEFTSWIEGMLAGRCSFDGWMVTHGLRVSDDICKAYRLDWIDYLLKKLQDEQPTAGLP